MQWEMLLDPARRGIKAVKHPLTAAGLPAAFRALLRIFRAGVRRGEGRFGLVGAVLPLKRSVIALTRHGLCLGQRQIHVPVSGEWGPAGSIPCCPPCSPDSPGEPPESLQGAP